MTSPAYPVRSEVSGFVSYTPGLSIEEIRARFHLDSVVKMASNENPLGCSPLAQKAIKENAAYVFRYPQSGNPRLVNALAAYHRLPAANFVPGNGSDEVIDLLVRVCPTPGEHNIVASRPSFSMYKIQSRLCGAEFREVPLRGDFSFDWRGLRAAVDHKTALVFVTTPDNPSGYCPPAADVRRFAASLPSSCLLVVDEAYMDFCRDEAAFSLLPGFAGFSNLVILRTFSKSFGLAGIRLGYGVMPAFLAERLLSAHMPFSVNILAEAAGIAALEDTVFHKTTIEAVREGRAFLARALEESECRVFPSEANFLMFQPPESRGKSARRIFETLLSKGMIIRSLHSYGLPGYLRVSVGSAEENRLFISLLREALAS
ncbi:MAG: histidinol-phosphate transaminase [Desulfovibrio sp.]|nr:histidinol-phosphate transaminase [Desulfovibrio sp.]